MPISMVRVLVTGAGSGIGREATRAFARRGALVYGAERLLADARGTPGVNAEGDAMVAATTDTGRLDAAFNNAGVTGEAHLKGYLIKDFDYVLQVNLKIVFLERP